MVFYILIRTLPGKAKSGELSAQVSDARKNAEKVCSIVKPAQGLTARNTSTASACVTFLVGEAASGT